MQLAQAMKTPLTSLRDSLHGHIKRQDEDRPPWRLHASDVTKEEGFCARYPVLVKQHSLPLPKRAVSTSMAVTWEWGRLVEARVLSWFAEMGYAFGQWECTHRGCKKVHEWQVRPKACAGCGGADFKYVETRATSGYSGVSSGLDMLVKMPGRQLLSFVEIKSIDAEKFKTLLAPLAEHRLRTTLSLRNIAEDKLERMRMVDDQTGFVLYVSKGGYGTKAMVEGGFTPFKEYQVQRNDALVKELAERARTTFLALQGEGPLPERFCKSHVDAKAQRCCALKACFS